MSGDIKDLPVTRKYNDYAEAYEDIESYVFKRCEDMPTASVIGLIEMLKHTILTSNE